jgi:hypothetical protein
LAGRVTPKTHVARRVGAARQHCQLDFPRHLELAFQRQPVGDLQDDEQVHEQETQDQSEGPGRPRWQVDADLKEGGAERHQYQIEAAEQLDDAEERDDERADVQRPARRRQPHRERDHELPGARRAASTTGPAHPRWPRVPP